MKSFKELAEEMGFSENASLSTQAAFIKHLIKKGYGVDVDVPAEFLDIKPATSKTSSDSSETLKGTQLKLDLDPDEPEKVG